MQLGQLPKPLTNAIGVAAATAVLLFLWASTLRSGLHYTTFAMRFVIPALALLAGIHFVRLLPVFLFFVVFPVFIPIGGASTSVGFLMAGLLMLIAVPYHILRRDFFTRTTTPWQLVVIFAGIALAFAHNPALPTRLVYQYNEYGSGFKLYAEQATKWAAFVYVCFAMQRMRDHDSLLSYLRNLILVGALIKLSIHFSHNPILYRLVGQDYYSLYYGGYIPRLIFVAPAFAQLLAAVLCWAPKHAALRVARPLAILACLAATAAGGTRTILAYALTLLLAYLLVTKRLATLLIAGLCLLALFTTFILSPDFRGLFPARYQRALLVTSHMWELEGLDKYAMESADTLEYREEIWRKAFKDIVRSPIIGTGFRPAPISRAGISHELRYERQVNIVSTHSIYLGLMLAWGVPCALLIFGWFALTFLRGMKLTWNEPRDTRGSSLLAFSLIQIPAMFVAGVALWGTLPVQNVIWFAMAHMCLIAHKQREVEHREQAEL